jgi:hypothetical protein
MAGLSAVQKQRCLWAMEELQKNQISRLFSQPVDPVRDNCSTYFHVIVTPMDLGTVRRKLECGQYLSVEQWKADVDLIWTNTSLFNGPKSLLTVVAKQLQSAFREITACLSSDVEADWLAKFERLKSEFNGLVKVAPRVPLTTKVIRKAVSTRSSSATVPTKLPEKPAAQQQPTAQLVPGMTTEEVARLADEVNLIEEPDQVDQIIDLIRTMEPNHIQNTEDDDDWLELEMAALEPATLIELRILVTKLLGR